jgi:hypothetical protein
MATITPELRGMLVELERLLTGFLEELRRINRSRARQNDA